MPVAISRYDLSRIHHGGTTKRGSHGNGDPRLSECAGPVSCPVGGSRRRVPLVTAGIWVRTDDGVMYFAMFEHTASEDLQKLLVKAQRP